MIYEQTITTTWRAVRPAGNTLQRGAIIHQDTKSLYWSSTESEAINLIEKGLAQDVRVLQGKDYVPKAVESHLVTTMTNPAAADNTWVSNERGLMPKVEEPVAEIPAETPAPPAEGEVSIE